MYYSEEFIRLVRNTVPLSFVVGEFVPLETFGGSAKHQWYRCLCPFHKEKTPSFLVLDTKGLFHCFGCGKFGNVFDFVQIFNQVSFPEAVKFVADLGQVYPKYPRHRRKQKRGRS